MLSLKLVLRGCLLSMMWWFGLQRVYDASIGCMATGQSLGIPLHLKRFVNPKDYVFLSISTIQIVACPESVSKRFSLGNLAVIPRTTATAFQQILIAAHYSQVAKHRLEVHECSCTSLH